MSCCPNIISPSHKASPDADYPVQDTAILSGESMDCYMQRAGNTTGKMDDKTDYLPNKIANTDIPLLRNGAVGPDEAGTTFKMTPFTPPEDSEEKERVPTSWSVDNAYGAEFTSNGATATLKGEFAKENMGKKLPITVTASDAEGVIDSRVYNISPSEDDGDSISFTHPLPGAVVTSKFGPRNPPKTGASSEHGGVDFAYTGGKVADVVSAADGKVVFTGYEAGGAGKYVKIEHRNKAGKLMCTTVYMHLAEIYVSTGQTVVQGQKIGKEGNTGVGTGAHLHFETRLPNGTKIDPLPLINGSTTVYPTTNAKNEGTGTPETVNSKAVLTPANVDARTECPAPGKDYIPTDKSPNGTQGTPPASGTPFSSAWNFTMKYEVGPHWTPEMENDPDVIAGNIDTLEGRKKTGYVNKPDYPGGETKFGIAQGPNPRVDVRNITYEEAKNLGSNNYWDKGGISPASLQEKYPKTAMALFDMNYLHGVGNANTIRKNAGITSIPEGASDEEIMNKLINSQQNFMKNIVKEKPSREKYLNGWLNRSNALRDAASKM